MDAHVVHVCVPAVPTEFMVYKNSLNKVLSPFNIQANWPSEMINQIHSLLPTF